LDEVSTADEFIFLKLYWGPMQVLWSLTDDVIYEDIKQILKPLSTGPS
jgi:hypothetical protein